jgi:hypothetical protein
MPCNFLQVVAYRGVAKLPQQLLGFTHMLATGRRDLDEDRDHFNLISALLAGDGRQIADQLRTRPDPRKIIITTRLTGPLRSPAPNLGNLGISDDRHRRHRSPSWSPAWRRFIAEQRNRLPEIPDKCLGIKANIEVDIVRQQARRDADESRRIVARAPPDRLKAFFLPHGMEVAQKRFRQLASRTPRSAAGIAALADLPRWLQTGIDWGLLWFRVRP